MSMNEPQQRFQEQWEEVDISAMTADELRFEQAAVKREIGLIQLDLDDEERVFRLGIDYPSWRRRARRALKHRQDELREVNAELQLKARSEAEARRRGPAQIARLREQLAKRARADALAADEGAMDRLLAGVCQAFHHDDTMTQDDRQLATRERGGAIATPTAPSTASSSWMSTPAASRRRRRASRRWRPSRRAIAASLAAIGPACPSAAPTARSICTTPPAERRA
jgi:hypothetical protein